VRFAAPLFLLGLLLVPVLLAALVAARRRARRYVVRFPATATVAALGGRVPAWRRNLPAALALASVALLAVALARPQATVAVPVERASVMMIIDVSRSMQATDVQPDRLQAAQRAARSFLDRLPDEARVGGLAYSDAVIAVEAPTTDHRVARNFIDGLVADGGTATGDAVLAALDAIEAERAEDGEGVRPAPAAIVLLSDGKTTVGSDPVEAARRAAELDVPIYTVALGTFEGVLPGTAFGPPLPVPPDPETLREMAQVSGGQAFEAADADALDTVYESLGSRIGTEDQRREVTAGFAGAGLLLLLGAAGLSLRFGGRLP
jgi:Ca-activated chloride channel homolog